MTNRIRLTVEDVDELRSEFKHARFESYLDKLAQTIAAYIDCDLRLAEQRDPLGIAERRLLVQVRNEGALKEERDEKLELSKAADRNLGDLRRRLDELDDNPGEAGALRSEIDSITTAKKGLDEELRQVRRNLRAISVARGNVTRIKNGIAADESIRAAIHTELLKQVLFFAIPIYSESEQQVDQTINGFASIGKKRKLFTLTNGETQEVRQKKDLVISKKFNQTSEIKITLTELEEQINELREILTSRRIAEEGDTTTYVNRLRKAFEKVSEEADRSKEALREPGQSILDYRSKLGEEVALLHAIDVRVLANLGPPPQEFEIWMKGDGRVTTGIVIPETGERADFADEEIKHQVLEEGRIPEVLQVHLDERLKFVDAVSDYLIASYRRLHSLSSDFCSKTQIEDSEALAREVAQKNESPLFLRPLPLFMGFAVALATKWSLARNESIVLHDSGLIILAGAFFVTWFASLYIGIRARAGMMSNLRGALMQQVQNLFGGRESKAGFGLFLPNIFRSLARFLPSTLRAWDRSFKIPHEKLGFYHVLPGDIPMTAFPRTSSMVESTVWMFTLNLAAPLAAYGFYVFVTSLNQAHPNENVFIGSINGSEACALARGRVVFATNRFFFVDKAKPAVGQNGKGQSDAEAASLGQVWPSSTIQAFFPEMFATPLQRDLIIATAQSSEFPEKYDVEGRPNESQNAIADCRSLTSKPTAMHVRHEGIGAERIRSGLYSVATALRKDNTLTIGADKELQDVVEGINAELKKRVDSPEWRNAQSSPLPNQQVVPANVSNEAKSVFMALVEKKEAAFTDEKVLAALAVVGSYLGGAKTNVSMIETLRFVIDLGLGGSNDGMSDVNFPRKLTLSTDEELTALLEPLAAISEQLEAANGTFEKLPVRTEPPIVFTAVFIDQSNAMSGKDLIQNNLLARFLVDGRPIKTLDQKNAVLLPFFPDPVTSVGNSKDAFKHGRKDDYFTVPEIRTSPSGQTETFFDYMTGPIVSCLRNPKFKITIDVQGFASGDWEDKIDEDEKKNRNHALAEGRRIAVLARLKKQIEDAKVGGNAAHRVFVIPSSAEDAEPVKLTDILATADLVAKTNLETFSKELEKVRRFNGFDDMIMDRNLWMSDKTSDDGLHGAFEKLLAQSAIFVLKKAEDANCVF